MIKSFKFLSIVLLKSQDEHDIYPDELFYTVNKEQMISPRFGRIIPKYTIVPRIVMGKYKYRFKPDHNALWYFKSKHNADRLIDEWKRYDEWELKQRKRRTR